MYALIRTQNGFYCSTVFAYYEQGWKSSVIVFDESNSRLIVVKCNCLLKGIRRDVLFVDEGKVNWIKNGKWIGLDFIVNDKYLMCSVKKGYAISAATLNKCKTLQTTKTFSDWNKLDTDIDIERLMNLSLDFHDAYIHGLEYKSKDVYVKFICWSCCITIKFVNIIKINEGKGISWGNNCIMKALMRFENGNIKWFVDSFCFRECDNQECYFIAESAEYKIELTDSF